MSVLGLKIEGPMQSWGSQSRFTERDTRPEPTKSGIIGLICSAMGRKRDESVEDLSCLRMGVRVDREGIVMKDYHTTLDVLRADKPNRPDEQAVVSDRFYLSDACFIVALEGNDELLNNIMAAFNDPVWPLYLGRKAFPPSSPIMFKGNKKDCNMSEFLRITPWQGRSSDKKPDKIRIIVESDSSDGEPRMDVPLSFGNRTYSRRWVNTYWIESKELPEEV